MARYAEPVDLLERHDSNVVNDLCNDAGSRESVMDLVLNNRLLTALDDASGEMDAALRTGSRYSTDDLEGLTGNSLSHLKRICSDIGISLLFDRRPGTHSQLSARYLEKAEKWLDQLRSGIHVFDVAAQVTAGNPTINGPSAIDYDRLQLIPERMVRFFPGRKQRLPTDRT